MSALDAKDSVVRNISVPVPNRLPTFHASSLGVCHTLITYDACVRICVHALAKGTLGNKFLDDDFALLKTTFGLQEIVLKSASEVSREGAATKPKKLVSDTKWDCISIDETVAYDILLEAAIKVQFNEHNSIVIQEPWKWLVTKFAAYYGVSDAYMELRYLSYVIDVATPTSKWVSVIYELLLPVMMTGRSLTDKENTILGEIGEQLEQIFGLVFNNYKSLDEETSNGMMDDFMVPPTGVAPPVLEPTLKLYKLVHDTSSPEAHDRLCSYFKDAVKKRWRRHLAETDEYVSGIGERDDPVAVSMAYKKMTSVCLKIRDEVFTDVQIHNCNILPSFVDLPNLSTEIYIAEVWNKLQAFLVSFPPTGPCPHVTDLVIATTDFQKDLASWNINIGLDAKEIFHLHIMNWIKDTRSSLLKTINDLDKVNLEGIRTQARTNMFVNEVYHLFEESLNDYEVIIRLWPEYILALENVIVCIEKAAMKTLEKRYADVVEPLKDNIGLKCVRKLTKRTTDLYMLPPEVGFLLNTIKRMLDVLRPEVENRLKSFGSGEVFSEVTTMLRSKLRSYIQQVVEKLLENTRLHNITNLKRIIQDGKGNVPESDFCSRMQPLREQLTNAISHIHTVFETRVFIATCRGYWDRMGQDVWSFVGDGKENASLYKASRVAVSILDNTFASQMRKLLGDTLQEKDVEPPRSIVDVRSMLC